MPIPGGPLPKPGQPGPLSDQTAPQNWSWSDHVRVAGQRFSGKQSATESALSALRGLMK